MAGYQKGILDSEQSPQFFKFYIPLHCSTQLRIPPAFVTYFENHLPLKFILETYSRKSWEVDVNKIDDYLYFKSGWEQFVQDNSLEFGDFLIFYYNGESRFYVSIYGTNNCHKGVVVSNNASEKQSTNIQQNKTNKNVGSLSFEVTMQQSYMTKGFVNTPKVFYKRVKEFRPIAKLQHSGRTWDTKVIFSEDGRIGFYQGWSLFVAENCVAYGDVCCFKLIDIKPKFYLLNVSISRGI